MIRTSPRTSWRSNWPRWTVGCAPIASAARGQSAAPAPSTTPTIRTAYIWPLPARGRRPPRPPRFLDRPAPRTRSNPDPHRRSLRRPTRRLAAALLAHRPPALPVPRPLRATPSACRPTRKRAPRAPVALPRGPVTARSGSAFRRPEIARAATRLSPTAPPWQARRAAAPIPATARRRRSWPPGWLARRSAAGCPASCR